jgi:Domain of unknown function (DUF4276)
VVFGIVVEAERDSEVYSALIKRVRNDVDHVVPRPCRDVVGVRRQFVGWLKYFQWHADPVAGKALVIRDSDCHGSREVEDELARVLDQDRGFRATLTLPVHFYATRRMVETWLLADENAVNKVARQRGKPGSVRPADDPLEGRTDSKELFRRMPTQAQLPADSKVYAEVAGAADLDRIKQRCPYFQRFIECVNGY